MSFGERRYVVRDVDAPDFIKTDFTIDGALHADGLDLSGIVPVGANAVHLGVHCTTDAGVGSAAFYRNNADYDENKIILYALGIATAHYVENAIIAVDADRKLDYFFSNIAWDVIDVVVLGWFI